MGCFIKIAGVEYSKEEFERNLSNPSFIKQLELEYSNDYSEYRGATTKIGQFKKYIDFKNNLITQLEDRVARLKDLRKKTTDKDKIKEIVKLQTQLEKRLNGDDNNIGLIEEVKRLEANRDINAVGYYAEKDINRLKTLSQSSNPDDLKEARKIINFYKAVGTFEANELQQFSNGEHPIFTETEIFNEDGTFKLPKAIMDQFQSWRKEVEAEENKIVIAEKKFIEDVLNSNPKIKKLYDKLTYQDISKPLQDISWLDMMIMDISNGILSHNGILPQVMLDVLEKKFEEKMVEAKNFEKRLDELLPKVEKELNNLGYGLNSVGILGVKGVSYELFKQKYNDGFETGRFVNRYSQEFYDTRSSFFHYFYSVLSQAKKAEDPERIAKAYNSRNNWYRSNTLMIDINQIPELNNSAVPDNTHVKELKALLGEQGYKEEIEKQKEQIEKWNKDFDIWKELLMEEKGVSKYEDLSDADKDQIAIYEREHSPFYGIQNYFNSLLPIYGNNVVYNSFKYNISVPRKVKVGFRSQSDKIVFTDSKELTGYYDKNYEKIESNPVLKEFYDLVFGQLKNINAALPAEIQKKMSVNSLPGIRKSVSETLLDSKLGFFKGLLSSAQSAYEKIKLGFGINVQSDISTASIDVVTGQPEYRINDTFLGNNREQMQLLFQLEATKLKQALDNKKSVDKYTTLQEKHLNPQVIKLLSEYLNVPPTAADILRKTGKYIKVGEIINKHVSHTIAQQQSFDLPKVMKYYSTMAAEYIARNESLPFMEMMKRHYNEIKNTATNNVGQTLTDYKSDTRTEGHRTNATKQMEDWFNRSVLGNFGKKESGEVVRKSVYTGTKENFIEYAKEMYSDFISGRILSHADKSFRRKLNKLIENENDSNQKEELEKLRDSLGKRFALSAAFDSILNYVRFLGLGYNVNSSITNFMEGQISNMVVASSEDFFKSQDYYRALDITKGSFIKNISMGKIATQGSIKARTLMDKYRIVQDSSNELQKASSKSAISGMDKFAPFELTRRVEYLNQTPLMIAIALNTEIIGKNGVKENLWDAMNPDGTLKPEFRTPENIANWENTDGEAYREFKIKVGKAIDTAHGNYSSLRGMMAKTSILGKSILMFKSWIGRAIYTRFAKPQDDLQMGVKGYKGRYWSHTPVSASMTGAIAGFAGFGFAGLAVGSGAGLFLGSFYGVKSSLGMLQEFAFNTKLLFRKALGNPINLVTGKELISTHANFKDFKGDNFTERDAKNLQANMTEMSILLSWITLTLIVKATMWDDEDEEESPRRQMHNQLVNKLMQLTSQGTMYISPPEFYSNTIGNLSVLSFLENVGKTAIEVNDYLQGFDTLGSGSNAGESALYNQIQKTFLPSIARDFPSMGFEKQGERQFKPSPFDSWYWSEEKKQEKILKGKRAARKKELREIYEAEIEDNSEAAQEWIERKIKKIVDREIPLS